MNSLKNYVKNNSKTLFKYDSVITNVVFDNKGFLFSDKAQLVYQQIKNLPHLYVAWTDCKNGFYYIENPFNKEEDGKDNMPII